MPSLRVIIKVHQTQDGLIPDIGNALVGESKTFDALVQLCRVHLNVQAAQQVFKNDSFDNTALNVINLLQCLKDLLLLATVVVHE